MRGKILFRFKSEQNSYTAIRRNEPNKIRKLFKEYDDATINRTTYIIPDANLIRVSRIL